MYQHPYDEIENGAWHNAILIFITLLKNKALCKWQMSIINQIVNTSWKTVWVICDKHGN